jgi:hypothetical protein
LEKNLRANSDLTKNVYLSDKTLLFPATSIDKIRLWVKRKQITICLVLVSVEASEGWGNRYAEYEMSVWNFLEDFLTKPFTKFKHLFLVARWQKWRRLHENTRKNS